MKTEQQIHDKIKEHEDKIIEMLFDKGETINEIIVITVETYLQCRKALLWVLSDKIMLPSEPNDFEKRIRYEIMCYESSKIF